VLTNAPGKQTTHRAMDDIKESVAELAYYRGAIFRPVAVPPEEPTP
jgi:oligoribonuclease (3'-5' exoribonuclease)